MWSRSDQSLSGPIVTVHHFRFISGDLNSWLKVFSVIFEEDTVFVLTSSNFIHGPNHISSAIYHALKAWTDRTARANVPSIEVLRWLTGSKQVHRALEVSAHGEPGSRLILMTIPKKAFDTGSPLHLPEVIVGRWNGPNIEGLEPMDPDDQVVWGGPEIWNVLEIDRGIEEENLELAVLEKVASTDL